MTTNSCTEGTTLDESAGFRLLKFKPAHSQTWTSTFVCQTFLSSSIRPQLFTLKHNPWPYTSPYALWIGWKPTGIYLLKVFFSLHKWLQKALFFRKFSVLYYALLVQVGNCLKTVHMQFHALFPLPIWFWFYCHSSLHKKIIIVIRIIPFMKQKY